MSVDLREPIGAALDAATGDLLDVRYAQVTPTELLREMGKVADRIQPADVPCGSCRACCWYGRVDVNPDEEKPEHLAHLQMDRDEKGYYLRHGEDGACIHLGEKGCTVHKHRPLVCRAYDCRIMGLAGLAPVSAKGHPSPVWHFPIVTALDRSIVLAASIASAPYMQAAKDGLPDPEGNVLVAVLKGIHDNLPKARAEVARQDAMGDRSCFRK
jgi:hypothetical protein